MKKADIILKLKKPELYRSPVRYLEHFLQPRNLETTSDTCDAHRRLEAADSHIGKGMLSRTTQPLSRICGQLRPHCSLAQPNLCNDQLARFGKLVGWESIAPVSLKKKCRRPDSPHGTAERNTPWKGMSATWSSDECC